MSSSFHERRIRKFLANPDAESYILATRFHDSQMPRIRQGVAERMMVPEARRDFLDMQFALAATRAGRNLSIQEISDSSTREALSRGVATGAVNEGDGGTREALSRGSRTFMMP